MEGWRDGRMQGWKDARMEGYRDGVMPDPGCFYAPTVLIGGMRNC
jgi:hypothetical protein